MLKRTRAPLPHQNPDRKKDLFLQLFVVVVAQNRDLSLKSLISPFNSSTNVFFSGSQIISNSSILSPLSYIHTQTHTRTHTHTNSLTHTHTHKHTHKLSLSHTHTRLSSFHPNPFLSLSFLFYSRGSKCH
jgi:hypothetical protein